MDEKIIKSYYERNPEGLPGSEQIPEIKEMHELFSFRVAEAKPNQLLEAGCGKGFLGERLSKLCGTYHGLDISSTAIAIAKRRVKDGSFREGTINKLPYADDSFDCVVCSEVLEHVPEYVTSIKELTRVAKVGALILVSTPNKINPDMLWRLMTRGKYTDQIYDKPIYYKTLTRIFASEGLNVREFFSFHYLPAFGEVLHGSIVQQISVIQKQVSLALNIPLGLYLFFSLVKEPSECV